MDKKKLKKFLFDAILEEFDSLKISDTRNLAIDNIIKAENDFKNEISNEAYKKYLDLDFKVGAFNYIYSKELLNFSIDYLLDFLEK